MYSWTGLYWGVNVGYSWGRDKNEWSLIGFGTVSESQKMDGVIGGFQSGYNYQFGQWVLGLETDFQASGQKGSSVYGSLPAHAERRPQAALVRNVAHPPGRAGVAERPALRHGRCGLWPGQAELHARRGRRGSATGSFKDMGPAGLRRRRRRGDRGGGWTAKLEYLYIDLGHRPHRSLRPVWARSPTGATA